MGRCQPPLLLRPTAPGYLPMFGGEDLCALRRPHKLLAYCFAQIAAEPCAPLQVAALQGILEVAKNGCGVARQIAEIKTSSLLQVMSQPAVQSP